MSEPENLVRKKHGSYWVQDTKVRKTPQSRHGMFCEMCEGKKVLHVGCTDYPFVNTKGGLHYHLDKCCEVDGVDTALDGLKRYSEAFSGQFYESLEDVTGKYDFILAPEVLEHVDNAGLFISQIDKIECSNLVVSVPDCLACLNMGHFQISDGRYSEAVHPDHVAWYSPYTLKNLVERNSSYKAKDFLIMGRSVVAVFTKTDD